MGRAPQILVLQASLYINLRSKQEEKRNGRLGMFSLDFFFFFLDRSLVWTFKRDFDLWISIKKLCLVKFSTSKNFNLYLIFVFTKHYLAIKKINKLD